MPKKDTSCTECGSKLTYLRNTEESKKVKERVCRSCGYVEKVKVESRGKP